MAELASTTISIDIGDEIDRQLEQLARETRQDKRDIAHDALIEWMQDLEK